MTAWMQRIAAQFGLDRQVFGNPAYIWIFGLTLFVLIFLVLYGSLLLFRRHAQRLQDCNGHSASAAAAATSAKPGG